MRWIYLPKKKHYLIVPLLVYNNETNPLFMTTCYSLY